MTSIGGYAFISATSLTSITIPASVTSIWFSAFANTPSLSAINVERGNMHFASIDGVLYNIDITTLIAAPGAITTVNIPASVTVICSSVFRGATSLTNVIFEEGSQLTSIGDGAFWGATSLTSITIPASVRYIKNLAFASCCCVGWATSLTTVLFEEGSQLTSIWALAFMGATSLTSITIPASVISIGVNVFDRWTNAQTIYVEGRTSAPSSWSASWLAGSNANVVWLG